METHSSLPSARPTNSASTAIHAGLLTTAANTVVHAVNIGRDAALALAFGTTVAVDGFFLAMMIPVFFATVGAGAYRNTIVPILERTIHLYGRVQARELIHRLMGNNLRAVTLVGLVLAVLAPLYSPFLAGRLHTDAAALMTTLTWAVLPMALLSAYAALAEGPLQIVGHYFLPSLFRGALPLGIAAGAILLGPTYGVLGACYGGALGALVQFLATWVLLPGHPGKGAANPNQMPLVQKEIRQQFGMLSAGVAIAYISPLVDQWMASFLGAGAVSVLSYANRLVVGAASLAVSALNPGLLPHFSRLATRGENGLLNKHYAAAVRMTWWVGIVMAGATWLVSEPFVALLYERGQFTHQDSLAVANIVGWFCLQFPPMLAGVAGSAMLSASGQNKTFLPLSVLITTVNAVGNLCLMPIYGLAGIALSTVATYVISLVTINVVLVRKGLIEPPLILLRDVVLSMGTAAALAAFVVMEDAKLAAVPTISQLSMSGLAMGMFGLIAFLCTKEVLRAIRRTA